MAIWSCMLLGLLILVSASRKTTDDLAEVKNYLDEYDKMAADIYYYSSEASWNYFTNITDETLRNSTEWSLKRSEFARREAINASRFDMYRIQDQNITRLLKKVTDIGISAFPDTAKLRQITKIQAVMTMTFYTATVCSNPTTCLPLDPDLTDIMANSRDYDELKAAWKDWRDASGKKMKHLYPKFVHLLNEAITFEKKYEDMGAYYRSWYESKTFENDVRDLFVELAPLYENLHAYVRRKLREHYGADKFPSTGHIPAHIFGDMWAEQWTNIYDLLVPYPYKESANIRKAMIDQNYNITHMYKVAEDFFTSIGFDEMPPLFWEKSMLVKPNDREVVCDASSAWDFRNGRDFRIQKCTEVNEDDLLTVHHEMAFVIYYLAYKHLPVLYRSGANPGFHEGVGDVVTLSFQTPEHLNKIGLLDNVPGPNDTEGDINFLLRMALEKVAFLPFGYLVDQWRWSVFRGETTPDRYNKKWWDLRCDFQGIYPPVERTSGDFDPGAMYHIARGVPFIRYFVSCVAQFQWHKALCKVGNIPGPLHRCDIYNNTAAGARLKEMLKMGASRPWGEAMLKITNGTDGQTDKLSTAPLLEYFNPLIKWLQKNNEENKETLGWNRKRCPNVSSAAVLSKSSISKCMGCNIGAILAFWSMVISNVNN